MSANWRNPETISPRGFKCGYCGRDVGPDKGYSSGSREIIIICSHCKNPSYFDNNNKQFPSARMGNDVQYITDEGVHTLYNEARDCTSKGAYTACVLTCRKILMHIAVDKGADEGLSFLQYVEYLNEKNYVPPGSKGWVNHIREKGNEANHEIKIMDQQEASKLLKFTEMLLKIIYEFPAEMKEE